MGWRMPPKFCQGLNVYPGAGGCAIVLPDFALKLRGLAALVESLSGRSRVCLLTKARRPGLKTGFAQMVFSSFSTRDLRLALCITTLVVAGSAAMASDGTSVSDPTRADARLVYADATLTQRPVSAVTPAPQVQAVRAASTAAPAQFSADERAMIRHRLLNRWSAGEFR